MFIVSYNHQIKILWLLPFVSLIPLICFNCLIVLGKTSSPVLSSCGENEQSCLGTDFSENAFSFSSFMLLLTVDLLQITCIMLYYVQCTPSLSRTFIIRNIGLCTRLFPQLMRWSLVFLSFSLFIWWVTFICLHMLNHFYISVMKLLADEGWSFWCIPGFDLQVFWEFSHLC